MKLFKVLSMACMLCTGLVSWGQEPSYNWGEPSTNSNLDREIDHLLTYGDNGFTFLRSKAAATGAKDYWIESYGTDMKLIEANRVQFSVGFMGDSYMIEEIIPSNNKAYVFVEHWNKEEGQSSLSVRELNTDGTMTDIAELDVISAQKMMNRGHWDMKFSEDGSKLLVLAEMPFVKKTMEKIRVTCFEVEGMKKLWSSDEELIWPSKRAYNNEISVDNKGRGYFFKKIWQKPVWNYELNTFDASGTMTTHDVLHLSEQEIVDFKMTFNNSNEFVFYATYSTNASNFEKRPHGSIYIKFDGDQKMVKENISAWSDDFLKTFAKIKDPAKNPKNNYLKNFALKDILFKSNGDALVMFEQYQLKKDAIDGTSPPKYTYTYRYGDFLVFSLNSSSGDVNWWQSFEKKQEVKSRATSDPYGSFVHFLKDDRLFILWNNTPLSVASIPPAGWTEPDGTRYVKHKAFNEKTKHATFLHVIEPDGSKAFENTKYGQPLFNMHAGSIFEMSMTTPIFFEMNGTLVIMASMHNGGKRYRFGMINF